MGKLIKTLFLAIGMLLLSLSVTPVVTDNLETSKSENILTLHKIGILGEEEFKTYPLLCPLNNQDIIRISSLFGERIHPIYNEPFYHNGVDYSAELGKDVIATGTGIITSACKDGGYGKQILIDHGNGYMTRYAHLSKLLVKKGDVVNQGDTIGKVGSTGISTGTHLHYELIHHNKCIDPLSIFPDTTKNYLAYQRKLNDQLLSCSDHMLNN